MSRPRTKSIQITVEVNGVEIPANLRRQRGRAGNWEVRWKMNGVADERSTGTPVEAEAKRVARQIIRGEEVVDGRRQHGVMSVAEFERIQKQHFALADRESAGEKTWSSFLGVWRSFLRACPIKTIQEVTEAVALDYVTVLGSSNKNRNHNYKKSTSSKTMSLGNVRKHIRTLAGAWNRIRAGHPKVKAGIVAAKRVTENPWEAVGNNVKKLPNRKKVSVQFCKERGELLKFLDTFQGRPIAELFVITSLWISGRFEETTFLEWSWFMEGCIVIPPEIAKRGYSRAYKIPDQIHERLMQFKVAGNDYVFAGFADEVARMLSSRRTVMPFSPKRMQWRMHRLIKRGAKLIGRPEITHHALRRTAMEWTNEGELLERRKASATKLQTTVGNMVKNYLGPLGPKEKLAAEGMYENMTLALQDHSAVAMRLGCDPVEITVEREMDALMKKLTPIQRRRFQKRLGDSGDEGEGQGVA